MSHEQPSSAEARPSVRSERYQGEFEDDERHGHGTCVFADGGKYTGAWRTGTIEGKGRYEHANGDVFEGEFSNRRRVRGRLQLADGGDEYDGEFDGELPHGEGKRTYAAVWLRSRAQTSLPRASLIAVLACPVKRCWCRK